MASRFVRFFRSNILGFIAIFIALGGMGVAAGLKKNSVKSGQIKDGQVKSVDVADNDLTGTDINEGALGQVPSAASTGNADKVDNLDSTQLVNGTGQLLDASLTVTSGLGNPTVLALPGLGLLQVSDCIPSATGASRYATLQFLNNSGAAVRVWSDGGVSSFYSNGAIGDTSSQVLGSAFGNNEANEMVLVHLFRPANGASADVTVGEKTDSVDCLFSVQALVSD